MADAQQLSDLLPEIGERARKLGLYLQGALIVGDGDRPLLVTRMAVGDVAFSKRVQDTDADHVDRQIEELTVRLHDDEFEAAKERMARNLAEGRSPLDDGEEA